jgi:hypothetical protein
MADYVGNPTAMTVFRSFFGAAVGIVFLNLALTLQNIWPTPWVRAVAEVSLETALIVLVAALFVEFRGFPGRTMRFVLFASALLLVIGRYADITAPALFGRRIDLFWDTEHLPAVTAMVAAAAPKWLVVAAAAGILAGIAALVIAVYMVVGGILNGMGHTAIRRGFGAVAALAVTLYAANGMGLNTGTQSWFAAPVAPVYADQAQFLLQAKQAQAAPQDSLPPSDIANAGGGDVYIYFSESYGAVAYTRPEMRAALADGYRTLEAHMARSGWETVSAFVDSPTFGGGSWLAHSSLLSGRWITEQPDYRLFLATRPETLVTRFHDAGYRTVALFPGIKMEWPESAGMRFDRVLTARDIDYHGPDFGWWAIPDQASLETFYDSEIARPNRKPLFLTFASISTHTPFGPTPPYLPDWRQITTAKPFADEQAEKALALAPEWTNLAPTYLRSVNYSLEMLGGFLENRAPKDALIVVLGDHQPPAAVSGTGESWSVPVHVFSRDKTILERFSAAGFQPGLSPAPPALMRMDALNHLLLRALDSSPRAVGALHR